MATLPAVTLTPGEHFVRVGTTPTVLLGTNPWAPTTADFAPLLAGAGVNDRIVRLFVHSLRQSPTFAGEVDEAWASGWDDVLCDAQANGLYVLLRTATTTTASDASISAASASPITTTIKCASTAVCSRSTRCTKAHRCPWRAFSPT